MHFLKLPTSIAPPIDKPIVLLLIDGAIESDIDCKPPINDGIKLDLEIELELEVDAKDIDIMDGIERELEMSLHDVLILRDDVLDFCGDAVFNLYGTVNFFAVYEACNVDCCFSLNVLLVNLCI